MSKYINLKWIFLVLIMSLRVIVKCCVWHFMLPAEAIFRQCHL